LKFDSSGEVSDYVRELDLKEAVAKVSLPAKWRPVSNAKVFASHPSDAIVIHLHAENLARLILKRNSIRLIPRKNGEGGEK